MSDDTVEWLQALEAAAQERPEGYLEIDEFTNALDYLQKAESFLRDTDDQFRWKWAALSLSNALYGFMICVLGQGNLYAVIDWPSGLIRELERLAKSGTNDALLEGLHLQDECYRTKRLKLISFHEALSRTRKSDRLGPCGAPIPFNLSSKQVNDVLKLRREYRDYFEHFVPMTSALVEAVFLGLFESCNAAIREVTSDWHLRIMHREDTEALDSTLDRVDELLKKRKHRLNNL